MSLLSGNTTFSLVSAPKIQINRNHAYYNPANYPLDPYLKDQLVKAANEKKIVHIEGPLLAPDSALSQVKINPAKKQNLLPGFLKSHLSVKKLGEK